MTWRRKRRFTQAHILYSCEHMCVYNMTLQWDCVLIVIAYRLCDDAVPHRESVSAASVKAPFGRFRSRINDVGRRRRQTVAGNNTVLNATTAATCVGVRVVVEIIDEKMKTRLYCLENCITVIKMSCKCPRDDASVGFIGGNERWISDVRLFFLSTSKS